jgi:hypothetical protein
VPLAVRSLAGHLADGDPAAWRAALRVLALAFGPAPDADDVDVVDPLDVRSMSSGQRAQLLARTLELHPELAVLVPSDRNGSG